MFGLMYMSFALFMHTFVCFLEVWLWPLGFIVSIGLLRNLSGVHIWGFYMLCFTIFRYSTFVRCSLLTMHSKIPLSCDINSNNPLSSRILPARLVSSHLHVQSPGQRPRRAQVN